MCSAVNFPLTHRAYSIACSQMAARGTPRVQVLRHRAVLCARVLECSHFHQREWFKVDTDIGQFWADARHVRLCSGDGRCTCEGSA